MKINLFYIVVAMVAIGGGGAVYNYVIQPIVFPPAVAVSTDPSAPITGSQVGVSPITEATSTQITNSSSTLAIAPTPTPSAGSSKGSGSSAPVIKAAAPPTVPTNVSAISVRDTSLVISWASSYDPTGVAGYRVYVGGKVIGDSATQRYELQNLQPLTSYAINVVAYNKAGLVSGKSKSLVVQTVALNSDPVITAAPTPPPPDKTPPTAPTNLVATAISDSSIVLTWDPSTDNVGVAGYKVYVAFYPFATTQDTTYENDNLRAQTSYTYFVTAYDDAGNESAHSPLVYGVTQNFGTDPSPLPDPTPSDTPTPTPTPSNGSPTPTPTPSGGSPTPTPTPSGSGGGDTTAPTASITAPANNATVSGTATITATASDNVGVTKVEFYVDSLLKASDTSSPYSYPWLTTGVSNGSHVLAVKAYDAAGNVGTSANVNVTVSNGTADTTAPSTPANLTATPNSSSKITLNWTASTDNVGVTGYNIYRGSKLIASTTAVTYVNSGLTAYTSYTYTVQAYDAAGNLSSQSTAATARTNATGVVDTISFTNAGQPNVTSTSINIGDQINFTLSTPNSSSNVHITFSPTSGPSAMTLTQSTPTQSYIFGTATTYTLTTSYGTSTIRVRNPND